MSEPLIRRLGAAVAVALVCTNGWSYEGPVHTTMARTAFTTLYSDPDGQLFRHLGITADQTFARQLSASRTALEWIIEGSSEEDFGTRPAYHFYDPVSGSGLNGNVIATLKCPPSSVCTSAPDWALNADTNNHNDAYSIPGARDSFYKALTTTDSIVRAAHWATTFQAVGQVIHLIQDMAQPQHVRNDVHFSLGSGTDSVLRNFSRYERFTRDQANQLTYTGYDAVKLSDWRKYWVEGTGTSGRGLAQFTNRYFVSQGTNFDKTSGQPGYYALPDISETQPATATINPTNYLGTAIVDPNGVPYTGVSIEYRTINYTDPYNPALSGTNTRLATKSYFDFVHAQTTGSSVYSMDNAVYQAAADILVPRAVGYSAGLIDYFFRGRLEISPPTDGVYGIVDHSTITQSDPSGFVGFSKIKLKVKNITPNENMTGGTLLAVAKFHRNPCYQSNLTGEFDEQHIDTEGNYFIPNCPAYRTPDEEIVVSEPIPVSGATILNFGDIRQFEFNFSNQQIPINARELKLQVVYRGVLGEETDAVAVETKDISEPTYLAVLNSTDYFVWQGHFYTVATAPAGMPRDSQGSLPATTEPVARTFRLYMDPNTPLDSPTATVSNLQPGHYARFAVLNELPSYYARAVIHRPEDDVAVAALGGAGWTAAQNQEDEQTNYFSPLGVFRNMRYFNLMWYFRSVDGTNPANDSEVTQPANPTPDPATAVNF